MVLISLLGKIKEKFHHKDIDEEIDEVFGKTRSEMVLEADKKMQEREQAAPEQMDQLPSQQQQAELANSYDINREAREPAKVPSQQPARTDDRNIALPNIPVLEEKPTAPETNKMDMEALLLELRSIKAQNDLVLQRIKKIEEAMQRVI